MVCLELATPVAKTCDAGGGALRSQRREWPGADYWANLVRAGTLANAGVCNVCEQVIRPELGWTMAGRIKSNFPQPELSGVMLEKANYQTPKTRKADKLRHGKALQNGTLANLGS